MQKPIRVLFLEGGWPGHQPERIVQMFSKALTERGHSIEISHSLRILADVSQLDSFDVVFPCWTLGTLTKDESEGLQTAVRNGIGLAGCHGGMGDAFRGDIGYEWMVGGHFVGHPHVGVYRVDVRNHHHAAMAGLPESFDYESEQYYMLVDPGIQVLADSVYVHEGLTCTMPVVWTKQWGQGRVFYSALGHLPEEFNKYPWVFEMTLRGVEWAARHNSLLP